MRITYVGAAFLAVDRDHPEPDLDRRWTSTTGVASFYGGTGLLIVVSVALDLVQKINSHLVMRNYPGLTDDLTPAGCFIEPSRREALRPMRLVFLGPPGSGKGTQARLLNERLGLEVIGTGDILAGRRQAWTPLGKQVEAYLASGRLAPDDLVNEVVAELFRRPDRPTNSSWTATRGRWRRPRSFDQGPDRLGLPLQRASCSPCRTKNWSGGSRAGGSPRAGATTPRRRSATGWLVYQDEHGTAGRLLPARRHGCARWTPRRTSKRSTRSSRRHVRLSRADMLRTFFQQPAGTEVAARDRADARGRQARRRGPRGCAGRWSEPGVETIEIDQAVEAFYEKHDAIAAVQGLPRAKVPFPAVTCISRQRAGGPRHPRAARPLRDGDL